MQPTKKQVEQMARKLTEKAAGEGLVMELGWRSTETMLLPKETTDAARKVMRDVFYLGAQHLWGSVMSFLQAGDDTEATIQDMARMSLVDIELKAFLEDFIKRRGVH